MNLKPNDRIPLSDKTNERLDQKKHYFNLYKQENITPSRPDTGSSKTSEVRFREDITAVYEKSRRYWDPSNKKETSAASIDQTKKDIGTLKTLAYGLLGNEILNRGDLAQHLGKRGTETKLTKIAEGDPYFF